MYKPAFLVKNIRGKVNFIHTNLLVEFTVSSIKSLLIVIVVALIKKAILHIPSLLALHDYWLIHALELTHEIYLLIIFIISILFDLWRFLKKSINNIDN